MNPYLRTGQPEIDAKEGPTIAVEIQTISGLWLGGFFGGPFAMTYLIYRDLVALGRTDVLCGVAAWFVPFSLFWLYCLVSFPPDFVSQFLLYLPQTIFWWIVARHILRNVHASVPDGGVLFVSRWRAVAFGVSVFAAMKLLILLVRFAFDGWA